MTDAELAATLAEVAGKIALAVRESEVFEEKGIGGAGDHIANAYLIRAIAAQRPEDGLLSEESKDTGARLGKSRAWIIDPIDGTREYAEGRIDWAVHVALVEDGVPVVGAVALPGSGLVLRSDRVTTVPPPPKRLRMVVSRTRPAREAIDVGRVLGAELIAMGSAGAKAMAIVRGEADIYLHTGGQFEWDSCAPVAVALAHGLHCSRIDRGPLIYNRADIYVPDLLICRLEHVALVMAALEQASAAPTP